MLLRRLLRTTSTYQSNPYHLLPVDACLLSVPRYCCLWFSAPRCLLKPPLFFLFSSRILVPLSHRKYLPVLLCLSQPNNLYDHVSSPSPSLTPKRTCTHWLSTYRFVPCLFSLPFLHLSNPNNRIADPIRSFPSLRRASFSVVCSFVIRVCVCGLSLSVQEQTIDHSDCQYPEMALSRGHSSRASSTNGLPFLTRLELTRPTSGIGPYTICECSDLPFLS